jgi:XTP/dITP diphosphohydrolase
MPKLLLATNNPAKAREYRSLLKDTGYQLVTPSEVGIHSSVAETGSSLKKNALLKAITMAASSGLLALADDSGLFVDALGGQPGVLSARYAGTQSTDTERLDYLLNKLKGVPWEKRTAQFRCVIAITTPDGPVDFYQGQCSGFISLAPEGKSGFGYDPVFYLPRRGKTMAELPPDIKNGLSHRGRAARKAATALQRLQSQQTPR